MSSLAGIKYDQIETSGDETDNDSQAGAEIWLFHKKYTECNYTFYSFWPILTPARNINENADVLL